MMAEMLWIPRFLLITLVLIPLRVNSQCEIRFSRRNKVFDFNLATSIQNHPHGALSEDGSLYMKSNALQQPQCWRGPIWMNIFNGYLLSPTKSKDNNIARSSGAQRLLSASSLDRASLATVVLDLDETLVCAYETSSLPAALRNQAIDAGLNWFELEFLSSDKKESDGKPKINYVTVFERPGLHEFLEQLSQFADLVLFTACLEGYARLLVDKRDTRKVLSNRLYRRVQVIKIPHNCI